jgi:hypothetical protein
LMRDPRFPGFETGRWKAVRRIKPSDYLLCYLTGVSQFIGVLEVVSEPFEAQSRIWKDEVSPSRVEVRVVISPPKTAVPIFS